MRNLVAQLIEQHPSDWMDILHREHKVHITLSESGDRVSLSYDQVEIHNRCTPTMEQCRGMVVRVADGKILAWPYNKFWNLHEKHAAPIDWGTARVFEKLDGSLIILYHDGVGWMAATSGHPTAGGPFHATGRTFAQVFWDVMTKQALFACDHLDPRLTYMLELCHPEGQIVVRHPWARVVFHGARVTESGHEVVPGGFSWSLVTSALETAGIEVVRSYPICEAGTAISAAEAVNPAHCEGFVVVDSGLNRVKIKSPKYVMLHRLKGEMTTRRAIELWQTGEAPELLSYFPEFALEVTAVHDRLDAIARGAASFFEKLMTTEGDPETRAVFAHMVGNRPDAAVLFRLHSAAAVDFPCFDAAVKIMQGMRVKALNRMLEGAL